MPVSPPNSYAEILMPKIIVLGDGPFERYLDHEDTALMNEIGPYKRDP